MYNVELAKTLDCNNKENTNKKLDYKLLIEFALDDKNRGLLNQNFSMFYEYSPLNSLLFSMQQLSKFGKVAPVANFKKWNKLGYRIKKGESALFGWMPCGGYKCKIKSIDDNGNEIEKELFINNRFMFKPIAFSMLSTNCEKLDINTVDASDFDYKKVIEKMGCKLIEFDASLGSNGNAGGYAYTDKKQIAINPLFDNGNSENIHTLFHELAHCLLHDKKQVTDNKLSRADKELEAEMTAYLVMNTISSKYNTDYSIGYIKNWLKGSKDGFTEKSCKRVLSVVNKIVKVIKELKSDN